MITVSDVSVRFSEKPLFKDVNLKFTNGNCYGITGANGAGKSTFLKVLSGELEHDSGTISISTGERMAVLKQDHFAYDEYSVKDTVMMGFPKLYELTKAIDAIYAKPDFSDEDGMKAADMQAEFGELGGYEAENQIEQMLSGLGLEEEFHDRMMSELDESQKVRVLLAQAIFGNPDILVLDEPTNGLDIESITWLENFLLEFENTVIVVSHDRHFLNTVCTYICDIDYGKITQFAGNYDFWYQMTQVLQRQAKEQQKKAEDKMKDLKEFILRFSSNAAKSKQATSRKKIYDKLAQSVEELPVSTRKFPYVNFKADREIGNNVLEVKSISFKDSDGVQLLKDFSLNVNRTDKIAFVGIEHNSISALFDIINEEKKPESGEYFWGQTTSHTYLPRDNSHFFDNDYNITEWLKQLFGESECKAGKGVIPMSLQMSTDLHSMGQFLQEGRQLFFETVLTVEQIRKDISLEDSVMAGKAATMHELNRIVEESARKAHLKNNTPNIRLTVQELSARSFGYMVYFFEKACAVSCYLTGVTPFDQPGVEAYKSNIKAALRGE